MTKCVVCNNQMTAEEVYLLKDWKTDRSLCQKHIDEVSDYITKKKVPKEREQ